jgi:lysine 2,3-aminomutase
MTVLRQTLRSAEDIVAAGLAPPQMRETIERVGERYAVAITPAMAELIDTRNPDDPISRQFIPDTRELVMQPGELIDPIGDGAKSPVKGIVHRYRDRVLLKIVGVCPVYCRFCFRREMVGPEAGENLTGDEIDAALGYIGKHSEVREVILTGGDPFVLSPRRVGDLTQAISQLAHVQIIRWHTRVPIVAPERVTTSMLSALTETRKTVVVAIHTNHPRELTAAARAALGRISDACIPLLSQTVLLKGINDDAAVLENLMRALTEMRVKPYYLHHADLAPGTSHFRTTIEEGQRIMSELRRRLPGCAVPSYVLDIPGGYGKVPIEIQSVARLADGSYLIRDPAGVMHTYIEHSGPAKRSASSS